MTHRVGPVGFEPTLWRSKSPLQSSFATSPRQSWVPPSGIEPEPPGLQPGAQTYYARVGYERRAVLGRHARGARSSSSSSSVVRDRPDRRAQGAPRAAMHPPVARVHLSRFEICIQITSRKSLVVGCRPWAESRKGRLVSRATLHHVDVWFTSSVGSTSRGTRIKTDQWAAKAMPTLFPRGDRARRRGIRGGLRLHM